MTKKLIVGSLKGGVGKTTVAVNLACALADGAKTVVLVDLDAQGTATEWIEPGHLPITGQGLPLENTGGIRRWVESEQGVKRLVEQVLSVDADIGIIDLPPHLSAIVAAALTLADLVIIPCGASVADVSATAKTLDLACAGVRPIGRVRELDARQPEHGWAVWKYLDTLVSEDRVARGRAAFRRHRKTLWAAHGRHRVHPKFIVAIWGVESDFGRNMGNFDAIAALATLAHPGLTPRDEIIPRLVDEGLGAIEAYHPRHGRANVSHYRALARKHELAVTGGSDYHGRPGETLGDATIGLRELDKLRALV